MNQMVPIHDVSLHDQLIAAHKARQARYAAAAIPNPAKSKTPKQLAEERFCYEAKIRLRAEAKRIELLHEEIQRRVEEEYKNELRGIRYPTVRRIISVVAMDYNLSTDDIISLRRTRGSNKTTDIVTPRQIAAYLSRHMTILTFPQIGMAMKRDHTTLISSCRKITKMMETSPLLRAKVEELRAAVMGRVGSGP